MPKKSNSIQEVAQPLSQGEKNFKEKHVVAVNKALVPGVTDQEHVFKGMPRKLDQPTASKEIYKDEDESKETYDKDLKRKEDYYATEEVVDEATLSAKAARAGKDIGAPGKNFASIAKAASEKYGSKEAGMKVAGAVLKKMRANEEVETSVEEVIEAEEKKKVAFKGYLKGNQHKIDKNHNGKIDSHDFKLLRKEEAHDINVPGGNGIISKKHANTTDYINKNVKHANSVKSSVDAMVKHDCAKHVAHEEWGMGTCIPECHTIVETSNGEGYVTHYDVEFDHGVELNVPVEDLTIIMSESHEHSRKSMKEDYDQDIDYEGEMAKAELKAICDKAGKLADMMTDDMQLEAWLQSKISRAKDYIDAVHDYLMYRENKDKSDALPAVPMATQAPMGTNYASFLSRMGEGTTAISKVKKAFESRLVEKGFVKPAKTILEEIETEIEEVVLSDEETARIKAILETD